jgi:hypothetical protein
LTSIPHHHHHPSLGATTFLPERDPTGNPHYSTTALAHTNILPTRPQLLPTFQSYNSFLLFPIFFFGFFFFFFSCFRPFRRLAPSRASSSIYPSLPNLLLLYLINNPPKSCLVPLELRSNPFTMGINNPLPSSMACEDPSSPLCIQTPDRLLTPKPQRSARSVARSCPPSSTPVKPSVLRRSSLPTS